MWWSKNKKPPEDASERLERIEKTVRMLELEWTDTYDKFRQLHMRVAKRVQRLEEAPETETTQQVEGGDAESPLSAHQREVQARIMQRRNRGKDGLLHG